jgi:hypothetical protein
MVLFVLKEDTEGVEVSVNQVQSGHACDQVMDANESTTIKSKVFADFVNNKVQPTQYLVWRGGARLRESHLIWLIN